MYIVIAVLLLATAPRANVSVSLSAPVNPALVQRRNVIAASLTPSAKLKLHNVAMSLLKSPAGITDGISRSAVTSAFPGVNFGDADINAVMVIVMMEVAESARADLKAMMDNLAAVNKQKDTLRHELGASANNAPRIRKVHTSTAAVLTIPPPLSPNATTAEKQQRSDDLADLGEEMQTRLRIYMERMTKADAMLTNILKKSNDASSSIIKNLK